MQWDLKWKAFFSVFNLEMPFKKRGVNWVLSRWNETISSKKYFYRSCFSPSNVLRYLIWFSAVKKNESYCTSHFRSSLKWFLGWSCVQSLSVMGGRVLCTAKSLLLKPFMSVVSEHPVVFRVYPMLLAQIVWWVQVTQWMLETESGQLHAKQVSYQLY